MGEHLPLHGMRPCIECSVRIGPFLDIIQLHHQAEECCRPKVLKAHNRLLHRTSRY